MSFPLADLPNANPVVRYRSQNRLDPYFDGMWETGSSASWWQRDVIESMASNGLLKGSVWTRPAEKGQAVSGLFGNRSAGRRKKVLAAINLWRTMTFEQLGAISGEHGQDSPNSADVHALWSAGFADVGKLTTPGTSHLPYLVRPNTRGDWDQLFDMLRFDDWVGITAGQPWRWGSQHDRHNVLLTELALRVAEYCPVPVVLGEQLAALNAMQPPGVPLTKQQSTLAGDAVLVRSDGLRIVVELTVSTRQVAAKAQRWADMLAAEDRGSMVVLFLLATHPTMPAGRRRKELFKAVHGAARSSMTHVLQGVPERMFVCEWLDWFPQRHLADRGFTELRALRSTGPSDDDRWEPVSLLDPFDLPGPDGWAEAFDIIANVRYLYGVPHWLRGGSVSATQVWGELNGVQPFPPMEGLPAPPQVRLALRESGGAA